MEKNCTHCSQSFTVTQTDLAFYDKVSPVIGGQKLSLPPPALCPDCRSQRRMAYRCERGFHARACDACGKRIISNYSSQAKSPVYCSQCWWGDSWNGCDYGQVFDFNQSFFKQYAQLRTHVPQLFLVIPQSENSDYSSYCSRVKNCYLLIAGDQAEDCLYGSYVWLSRSCVDCMNVIKCEQCYECIECEECYHCLYSQQLDNCSDCTLCFDCKGSKHCFGCVGLRNKEYHFFNEPLSREEYEQRTAACTLTPENIAAWRAEREPIRLQHPHKYAQILNCQDCSGDALSQSKNAKQCFDCFGLEDCQYIVNGPDEIKDCYDFTGVTYSQVSYEGVSIHGATRNLFCERCWQGNSDIAYCSLCIGCTHCFGCIGLKKQQYCILNKQYSQAEYEALVPKIVDYMRSTNEYGEFPPITESPFPYNETLAQDYHPLMHNEAKQLGYAWCEKTDDTTDTQKVIPASKIPSHIAAVPDDILSWALQCEASGRLFRIARRELDFYRQHGIPIPHFHPDHRHELRMALRNPHKLWSRQCAKCSKAVQTTYAPKRPEIIYCEECYLETMY